MLAIVVPRGAAGFAVLAALLAFFSLDDMVAIHEAVVVRLEPVVGIREAYRRLLWPVLWFPALAGAFVLLVNA